MTTDLLALPGQRTFFMSDGFGFEPTVYAGSKGNSVYANVAVFRSGTFRDSMGSQNTWEDLHLKQMMDNFDYLRKKSIMVSVPARDGHPGFIVNGMRGKGEVVGWHQDVKTRVLKSPVDGKEYTYLLADYEITQQYALEKINNGTWRNRSAEIGGYVTNAESEFWPVYLGFAFVDFPAVEGLNFSSPNGKFYAFFDGTSRESSVTDNANTGAGQGAPQLPFPVLPNGAQHTVPQTQQTPAQPAPFVFSVNGQNVTDPNQVQAYVRQLETFVRETRESGRKGFVAGLVTSNKIGAPQQPDMEKFALSLNDEQYAAWSAQWSAAQPLALLANHGGGASNLANAAQAGQTPQDQAIADAEAIVKMHEIGGTMKPEQLKQTASYKALVAAGKRPA